MAAATALNPLSANDIALAQQVIDIGTNIVLPYYSKCTTCGHNVSQLIAQVQANVDYAKQLLKEFGSENG